MKTYTEITKALIEQQVAEGNYDRETIEFHINDILDSSEVVKLAFNADLITPMELKHYLKLGGQNEYKNS